MTTTATAPEPTVDTVEIVPSFIRDSWWTPDAGSAAGAALRPGRQHRRTPRQGEHRGTGPRRRRGLRTHHRPGGTRQADLPPARAQAQGTGAVPQRPPRGVLRALGADRRHQDRLDGRHRRRHRRALHLRLQGPPRTAQRPGDRGRPHGGAVQGRLLRRRAHLHPHPRRRRADQRLQLPGLGHAGEARPRLHRRRAHHRQARHPHRLRHRRRGQGDRSNPASCPRARCS